MVETATKEVSRSAELESPRNGTGIRGNPTIADTWRELAAFSFSDREFPRRFHSAALGSSPLALPTEKLSIKQRIHDIRQAMRYIGTLEPPEISGAEVQQWEALFKKLTGIDVKLIKRDPNSPDTGQAQPLFKYIAGEKGSKNKGHYEVSLALLSGDNLPLRNSHIALVLSWVVADNLYHKLKGNRLTAPFVRLSEFLTATLFRGTIHRYEASSQELLTALPFLPLYKLHFKRKTKGLHMAPETRMAEIKAEYFKHNRQNSALLGAAEVIAKSSGDNSQHKWGVSQYAASKRVALAAAKFGGSECAVAAALFSQIDKKALWSSINQVSPSKMRTRLERAYQLASSYESFERPFKVAVPAHPERPSQFLNDLQGSFLQRLQNWHQVLYAMSGVGTPLEDLYILHNAILVEKAGFLTPLRKSAETGRLANQILAIEAPLAERLGLAEMYEALMTTSVRIKFPMRFHAYQVALQEETGMNFRERMAWHDSQKAYLTKVLTAYGLEPGKKATEDTPEVSPAFQIEGSPKRIYKVILKLADALLTDKKIDEETGPFLSDPFRLGLIFKNPSKLTLTDFATSSDVLWTPSQLVEIFHKRLPQLFGTCREEPNLVRHHDEVWFNFEISVPHPTIPERTLNFELQIMTDRFHKEIYAKGLPMFAGLRYGSSAHWSRQAERNLRIAMADSFAEEDQSTRLKFMKSGFASKQLFNGDGVNLRSSLNARLTKLCHRAQTHTNIEVGVSSLSESEIISQYNSGEGIPSVAKSYLRSHIKGIGAQQQQRNACAFDVLLDPDLGADFAVQSLFEIKKGKGKYSLRELSLDDPIAAGKAYVVAKSAKVHEIDNELNARLLEVSNTLRAKIWLYGNGEETSNLIDEGRAKISRWLNLDPKDHLADVLQFFGLENEAELYRGVSQLLIKRADLEKWLRQSFVAVTAHIETRSIGVEFDEVGRGALSELFKVCRRTGHFPDHIEMANSRSLQKQSFVLAFSDKIERDLLSELTEEFRLIRRKRELDPPVRFGFQRRIEAYVETEGLEELTSALAGKNINIEGISMKREPGQVGGEAAWVVLDITGPDQFLKVDEVTLHEKTREDIEALLRGLKVEKRVLAENPKGSNTFPVLIDFEVHQVTLRDD